MRDYDRDFMKYECNKEKLVKSRTFFLLARLLRRAERCCEEELGWMTTKKKKLTRKGQTNKSEKRNHILWLWKSINNYNALT